MAEPNNNANPVEEIVPKGLIGKLILFCIDNKFIVGALTAALMLWGVMVAPFDWDVGGLPRDPVPVDAIPDIGENQQIVFTNWPGHSPQDIEDQVSYPLTVSLLGLPDVKTVRSFSMFGFSSIYVIFKENVDFYWSRSRILEKLNSLPSNTLPPGVSPALGPDATGLGQVYWYTLEGFDVETGEQTGGWNLDELRSTQDFYVRYGLQAVDGISEVASVGGYVREYQIDVDPDAMRAYGVKLSDVFHAVKMANNDVGARTIEVNGVEYIIRGLGFIKNLSDIENAVIRVEGTTPIYVKNVAQVVFGPQPRRGALDKGGAEAVGGVAVVRYGANPLAAIKNLKQKIAEISPGLPTKTLSDGRVSQLKIVPFYDRSELIHETLETLDEALTLEILVTIIVVIISLMSLRSSLLVSGLLPIAVLMSFAAMKVFAIDANIVALSGIAIAIGTMVDMGIVMSENIISGISRAPAGADMRKVIYEAANEVGSAVLTAVATTVVSFLPVFTMVASEGKLFKPLAYTKTFALIASVVVALTVIPAFAQALLVIRKKAQGKQVSSRVRFTMPALFVIVGIGLAIYGMLWAALILVVVGVWRIVSHRLPAKVVKYTPWFANGVAAAIAMGLLAKEWSPLGIEGGQIINFAFVLFLMGTLLYAFDLLKRYYVAMLNWVLNHRPLFLSATSALVLMGVMVWIGFDGVFGWMPRAVKTAPGISSIAHAFPGLGKEFMPPLEEGSFLFMPTTMPHAGIGEAKDMLSIQDAMIASIPEVTTVVGKLGRTESPLDPAPVSMFETVVNYHKEYYTDSAGNALFKYDEDDKDLFRNLKGEPVSAPDGEPYLVRGKFLRDASGRLIPDEDGFPFRLWRKALDPTLNDDREAWAGITSSRDIWDALIGVTELPGVTSAPFLEPIAARLVMLQSGMRAPMGIKVKGPNLKVIEDVGVQMERFLKEVPSVNPPSVFADRIIGKPYLEIEIDREAIARYGIKLDDALSVIEVAVGGKPITMTVEGRERYPVRVRYLRELRDDLESLGRILVPTKDGAQIPLEQLATINYVSGPQNIKSEDTFLTGYVLFDKKPGHAEVDVVEEAQAYLQLKIDDGELIIPNGVNYKFAGSYENQIRAMKTLSLVVPIALLVIMFILYLQFKSILTTLLVFAGVFVAWSGGFIMIWLYGQGWFMNFSFFGENMRELFNMHQINLSVAVWVGFLALFGIATDNGVVISAFLDQSFARNKPKTIKEVRHSVVEGSQRRIRPALMTTATTLLALLPILTSTGRGSDIMIPMAIPSFGGMTVALLTIFTVPVLYSIIEERKLKRRLALSQ